MDTSPETALRQQFLAYIAGTLPDAERDQVELRMLEDQEFSDSITTLEYELFDDLAAGVLSQEDARTVSAWAEALPDRSRRARMSKLLRQQKTHSQPRSTARWAPALALAACLLVVAGFFLWRSQHGRSVPAKSTVADKSATAPFTPKPDTILLFAERLRGPASRLQSYPIYRDAPIRLQLLVPTSSKDDRYSLELTRDDGHSSIERAGLTATVIGGLRFVETVLPAASLSPGAYIATLHGPSGDLRSSFSVAWKP